MQWKYLPLHIIDVFYYLILQLLNFMSLIIAGLNNKIFQELENLIKTSQYMKMALRSEMKNF